MGNNLRPVQKEHREIDCETIHCKPVNQFLQPSFKYKYANRLCLYRSEKLEISPEELNTIKQLIQKSKENIAEGKVNPIQEQLNKLEGERPLKLIIDTDIGTDIDDVLTLLAICHISPEEVELLGVTTNYYPTKCRKYVARAILDAAGLQHVPVFAGSSYLCGTHRPIFLHGNEGEGLNLSEEELKKLWEPVSEEEDETVEFLNNTVCKYSGKVSVIAIGMMTNLAKCAHKYPDWGNHCAHIVIMGGGSVVTTKNIELDSFGTYSLSPKDWGPMGSGRLSNEPPIFLLPSKETDIDKWLNEGNPIHLLPNHNFSGDSLATCKLFSTCPNTPISVIPHYITAQHWLKGLSIETLLDLSTHQKEQDLNEEKIDNCPSETILCGKLLYEWLSRRRMQRGQCPHDPLTLYEAIYPQEAPEINSVEEEKSKFTKGRASLTYVQGTFVVHEWAAFATFVPDPNGSHRLAVSCLDPSAWLTWLEETLIRGIPESMLTQNSDVKTTRTWT